VWRCPEDKPREELLKRKRETPEGGKIAKMAEKKNRTVTTSGF